jgi:hypothetical protein
MANFNVPPYYDDYDETKNYYKILFRPSVAIQARELNQMQTMLQKQVERFGAHIFREGSIVLGGAFDLELDVSYVKAASIQPSSTSLDSLVDKTVVGQTTGITAVIRAVTYDKSNNVYAILLRYLSGSENSDVFVNEEIVTVSDDASLGFTVVTSATEEYVGRGSIFSIGQGVVFTKGYFVAFPKQTVILNKYSMKPTSTVGLMISENIVTELQDETLNDNSLGTPNENAPGAHRYNIEAVLTIIDYKKGYDEENFINLIHIDKGILEDTKERTQYSRIYDELARRTYEESGDYFVNGLDTLTREHLDTGSNEGLYKLNKGGDSKKLSVDVRPGVAFVKGYEVTKRGTEHVIIDKATEYDTVNNQLVNARTGGYFLINEIAGTVNHDKGFIVNLYETAEQRVSNGTSNITAPTAKIIGTARMKAMIYENGVLGSPNAQMRAYLYDYSMNSGYTLNDARAIGSTTAGNKFFADIVLNTNNKAVFYASNRNDLLIDLGATGVKSIRSEAGTVDTTFQFIRSEDKSANLISSDAITTSVSTTGETLAYSEGSLSAAERREIIVSLNSNTLIELAGTVTGTSSNNILTGTSTDFTKLSEGNRLSINAGATYIISSITNSTSLILTSNVSTSFTGNVFYKSLLSGDILDLTATGSTGDTRTATVSGGTLSIDLKERTSNITPSSVSAKINYRVDRSSAAEVKKILNPNRFVKFNIGTSNTVGPYNLGLSDIYKIRSIRMDSSAFSNATGSTSSSNVTTYFTLDNGQRDNLYDHGKLIYKGGLDISGKHLLVELDHFVPSYSGGFGYFSVDSYPIDDVTQANNTIFTYNIPTYRTSSGIVYDLKNVLDFRSVIQATAVSAETVGTATTNPATSTSIITDTDGLRMVVPDSDIVVDYQYYLPRIDIISLNTEGIFNVIKGEPSLTPVTPPISDSVMGIAKVYVPPYPSVSQKLARILDLRGNICTAEKIANIRYTMRDIDVLKKRIEALEYYNAITLLEKSAVDLTVTDKNGLDRFKNGFFADGFADHSLGDTQNPDYKISVDSAGQLIRPVFNMDSFDYQLEPLGSSNYKMFGDLITLPYNEVAFIENKQVTTIRNIEQSVFRFIGTMTLDPKVDTWVDTKNTTKKIVFGAEDVKEGTVYSDWSDWENKSSGSLALYARAKDDTKFDTEKNQQPVKTFDSIAEARKFYDRTYDIEDNVNNIAAAGNGSVAASFAAGSVSLGGPRYFLHGETPDRERTRTATTTTLFKDTETVGNFITDVSVVPFIRPQTIQINVYGLRKNTALYCFFDGEDMSEYCTLGVIPEGGGFDDATFTTNAEGAQLRSNQKGRFTCQLRIPNEGKRFTIGTKDVIITDSPTNAPDATTFAKGTWTASGLKVKKQETIITTKIPVVTTKTQTQTKEGEYIDEIWGPSCMAYSFKVGGIPKNEDGIFLTSVDVWVNAKHAELGAWFEIRAMDSGGSITRTQVPGSEIWLNNEDINLWDGSAATEESKYTRVTFDFPIFLMNDTQYAFVIHTEGLNPDYYFWVSRLGETDILTDKPVRSRQLTGTLFTTNNNLNYDIVPDVDLKVRFNRAQFQTGTATVLLGNKPVEFLNIANNYGDFTQAGEKIFSSEILNFSSRTFGANSIASNDIIRGVTTNVSANVLYSNGVNYYVDYYGFSANETFNVYDYANTSKSITGTITLVSSGTGKLRSYNSKNNFMIIDKSNGKFYANARIFGLKSGNSATISSFDQFKYSTTNLKLYELSFKKTDFSASKAGWLSNTAANDFDTRSNGSMWFPGKIDASSEFNNEVTILSRANEIAKFGTDVPSSTARVLVNMSTSSEYVSPVIDIGKAKSVFVHNIINNDITGEANSSGGSLINKYISKPVTLADGQDAEDLLVVLSSYKPKTTDVKVWMKVKHAEDTVEFSNNQWVEMAYKENLYSSSANKEDYKELTYNVPNNYKNSNGILQYIKGATTIYPNTVWSNSSGYYGVNASADAILIPGANTIFTANALVYYAVPPDQKAIIGSYSNGSALVPFEANTYYRIDTVNSTAITLKTAEANSSNLYTSIDFTEFRTSELATHTIGGTVFTGFKQFSMKIGLLGDDSANPPKVSDARAIALQM